MGFRDAFSKLGGAAKLAAQASGEMTVATGQAVGSGAVVVARGTVVVARATWRVLMSRFVRRTAAVAGTAAVGTVTSLVVTAVAGPIAGPIAGAVAAAATGQALRGSGGDSAVASQEGDPPTGQV